jgi:hypothetical protein
MKHMLAIALICTFCTAAAADDPLVESVTAERAGMGWRITVTLSHPDTGWDHYADGWEVLDRLGNRLGYRELMHPHVQEQPFTRSLFDVMVPDGERVVYIRTRCSEQGWSKTMERVELKP